MSRDHTRKFTSLVRDLWAARPRGWQLVTLLAMCGALIGMALCAAVPSEVEAISVSDPLAAKGLCIFLLAGSVVLGAFAGAVETTGTRGIAETLPGSPLAVSIRTFLIRLVRTIASWWICASFFLLRAEARIVRLPVRRDLPKTPGADLWPAGDGPRIIYERQRPLVVTRR